MHIGKRNLEFQYQMNNGGVKSVDEERDLGVLMSKDLKFSKQCQMSKNKANFLLGIIKRGVSYKSAIVISKLYRSGYASVRVLYPVLVTNECERCRCARRGTEKSN